MVGRPRQVIENLVMHIMSGKRRSVRAARQQARRVAAALAEVFGY
jgi:hypothetical protein